MTNDVSKVFTFFRTQSPLFSRAVPRPTIAQLSQRFPRLDGWLIIAGLILAAVLAPVVGVLLGAIQPGGGHWEHLTKTVLSGYLIRTAGLVLAASLVAVLTALPAAWLTAAYRFPGSQVFIWALVLPLAVPTYVAAFAYADALHASFPVAAWAHDFLGMRRATADSTYVFLLLSLVLGSVLYPYVYLACRTVFVDTGTRAFEAARSLGASPSRAFFHVALPCARAALAAGLALVVMEVINDYGAVQFFTFPTITSGIFNSWKANELPATLRLASIGMLAVIVVIGLERASRRRGRSTAGGDSRSRPRPRLTGFRGYTATTICILALIPGFFYPVSTLIIWATRTPPHNGWSAFFTTAWHSIALAAGGSAIIVAAAVLLTYASHLHRRSWLPALSRISVLGYAAPGAVIGIGLLAPAGFLDREIGTQVFIGSFGLLTLAYLIRFLSVAHAPIGAAQENHCTHPDEAARSLGASPANALLRVGLPLLKPALIAAATLCFVDILKELPLTIILRGTDFETLATSALNQAESGHITRVAWPSLTIIATGALSAFLLSKRH